jgi:macrodomain Ter protein organizer (MatP/YcbG family)
MLTMGIYNIPKRIYWVEPTKMKVVRVEDKLWKAFTKKARSLGWKPSELAFLVVDQRLQRGDKIRIENVSIKTRSPLSFRFSEKMWNKLDEVARRINSSRSEVFRQILSDFLRDK